MKIAYCDDEPAQAVYLTELLTKWQEENQENCELTQYHSAREMLFENADSFPFDFILLDVQMDEMNGIELAKRIRKIDDKVVIAFLSNRPEYVFDGYEVAAARYLLKPVRQEQLFELLAEILKKAAKQKNYLILTVEAETVKIDVDEIIYLEADSHYVHLHTKKADFQVKNKLAALYDQMNSQQMLRVHRSYIVNLAYIDRVTKTDCILSDGKMIPVSRNLYKTVNEAFISYYKGGVL